jgi:hypothetical protein
MSVVAARKKEDPRWGQATSLAQDTNSGLAVVGKQCSGNSGAPSRSILHLETVAASTQASNPESAELSSNVSYYNERKATVATTGEGNQAATAVESKEADARAKATKPIWWGNARQKQTSYSNDQGGTGYSSNLQTPRIMCFQQKQRDGTAAVPPAPTETTAGGIQKGYQQAGFAGQQRRLRPTPTQVHRGKGTYQQVGISAGLPTAAQVLAPTPTETTEVARINKGIKKLWWRYKAGNHGNATPATSPTPPSEAAVVAARQPGRRWIIMPPTTGRRRKKREL